MSKRISSLGDLNKAIRDRSIDSAINFYETGNYKEAVEPTKGLRQLLSQPKSLFHKGYRSDITRTCLGKFYWEAKEFKPMRWKLLQIS